MGLRHKKSAVLLLVAVLVSVSCRAPGAAGARRFPDVAGHWCEAEIEEASALGFVEGYPDGKMWPDAKVTRAEFLKMVVAAFGFEPYGRSLWPFADVAQHWCARYLDAALEAKVVRPSEYVSDPGPRTDDFVAGEAGPRYYPDGFITRDEAAAYTVRALGVSGPAAAPFRDMGTVRDTWQDEVALCSQLGVLKGYGDGTVRCNRALTRAEAVAMVLRALKVQNTKPAASVERVGKFLKVWYDVSGTMETRAKDGGLKREAIEQKLGFYCGSPLLRMKCGDVEYRDMDGIWYQWPGEYSGRAEEYAIEFSPDRAGILALLCALPLRGRLLGDPYERPINQHSVQGFPLIGLKIEGEEKGSQKGPYWCVREGGWCLCKEVSCSWEARYSDGRHAWGDFAVTAEYDPVRGCVAKAHLVYHGVFEHTGTSVAAEVTVAARSASESEQFEVDPF
ncbi:MAG: S-layer homology domain-containing protein [Bacillota bacterium]